MKDIVIELNKGMVSNIFCDRKDVRFIVIDWDLRERQEATLASIEAHKPIIALSESASNQLDRLTRSI